jgi:hypothetical protein
MDDNVAHLIGDLTDDLRPVRRIETPWLSAAIWIGVAVIMGIGLYTMRDQMPWAGPLAPDAFTVPGLVTSGLTAVLAVIAAFQLSLPDRSSTWAILPLPAFAAWVIITGLGCLAYTSTPGAIPGPWPGFVQCLSVLVLLSLPLTVILVMMVRRARPLRPVRVALLGGLATAAAAGTLLCFVHPHDATALDLAAHSLAVLAIVGINSVLGGRLLVPANKFVRRT